MPELMNYIDNVDDVKIPELMYVQATPSAHARDVHGRPLPAGQHLHHQPDGAWGASTQGAVSRLLSFVNATQNRLRAAMGGMLSEEQKKFMAAHMAHDLTMLEELHGKPSHLLQHPGFQGQESTTTVDEIKKTMKQDIVDINVIDARCKTLQRLEGRT